MAKVRAPTYLKARRRAQARTRGASVLTPSPLPTRLRLIILPALPVIVARRMATGRLCTVSPRMRTRPARRSSP